MPGVISYFAEYSRRTLYTPLEFSVKIFPLWECISWILAILTSLCLEVHLFNSRGWLRFPTPAPWSEIALKVVRQVNCRAYQVCFSPLRDHWPILVDVWCLENPCFIFWRIFILCFFRWENKSGLSWPEVEVFYLITYNDLVPAQSINSLQ